MAEVALRFKDEDEVGLESQGKTKSKCLKEKWIQLNSQQWRIKQCNPRSPGRGIRGQIYWKNRTMSLIFIEQLNPFI